MKRIVNGRRHDTATATEIAELTALRSDVAAVLAGVAGGAAFEASAR